MVIKETEAVILDNFVSSKEVFQKLLSLKSNSCSQCSFEVVQHFKVMEIKTVYLI